MVKYDNKSLANGQSIKELRAAISRSQSLNITAHSIYRMIENGAWKYYYSDFTDEVYQYEDHQFAEWITKSPPEGLATTIQRLKDICKDSPDALAKLEGALLPMAKHGVNQHDKVGGYIEPPKIKRGTGRDYIISRLKRDAPNIAEQVIQRELSAQAGKRKAIEDGLWIQNSRKNNNKILIKDVHDIDNVVKVLVDKLTDSEKLQLLAGIEKSLS
jgi:hypothetical protein